MAKTVRTSQFYQASTSFNLFWLRMSFWIVSNGLDAKLKSLVGNYKKYQKVS